MQCLPSQITVVNRRSFITNSLDIYLVLVLTLARCNVIADLGDM